MGVTDGETVGVGVKVDVGVAVGMVEAVQVGVGRLVSVWLGCGVMVARVADGRVVEVGLARASQPDRTRTTSNEKKNRVNG